jgi:hypothetical protein
MLITTQYKNHPRRESAQEVDIRESRISALASGTVSGTALGNEEMELNPVFLAFLTHFAAEFVHQIEDSLADLQQLLSRFD